MTLRVVDLFSGAGGFSLGFHAAGCEVQAAADRDGIAGETFRSNFQILQPDSPPDVLAGEDADLEQVRPWEVMGPPPDILIGGPPCQAFSMIGRAKLDSLSDDGFEGDPRNELFRVFVDAVEHWRPRAFVMENVPGMLSVGGKNIADEAAAELARKGYEVGYAVLNAIWYGVPQFRNRLFIAGVRQDLGVKPSMPRGTHSMKLAPSYTLPRSFQFALPFVHHGELPVDLEAARLPATAVADALDDLPELTDHFDSDLRPRADFRSVLEYRSEAHSEYAGLLRQWPGLPVPRYIDDHAIRRTPRDYETFGRMKPGDRYPQALAIAWQRLEQEVAVRTAAGKEVDRADLQRQIVPPYPEDIFVDKWRKLVAGEPSWTVTAHLSRDSYSHIHHDSRQKRAISIREAARLQSFPDAFRFSGNMGDCFRQIGNAVPPLMAWGIASQLLDALGVPTRHPPFEHPSIDPGH